QFIQSPERPRIGSARAAEDLPRSHVDGIAPDGVAGRRTYDTRDEFCVALFSISAGVLLPRPAYTKTSCVGFRETQRPRAQIPSSNSAFPFSPKRKSSSSVAACLPSALAQVLPVC